MSDPTPLSEPELSVVLAATGGGQLGEALNSLHRACQGISTEYIVVSAGSSPDRLPADPSLREVLLTPGALAPDLWGAGLRAAGGRWVAFTTEQMRVSPTWASGLLAALYAGAAGAGGPIGLAPGADPATTAAYFVRFSAFLPSIWPTAAKARDIPGDNAAYRRAALLQETDLVAGGFWEVEYHRRLERRGEFLEMAPGAVATLSAGIPFGRLLRQRYRHAREFGASRVRRHGESRWKLLALAPLVPLALLARIGRRVLPSGRERGRFLAALPWLILLAGAWATGEAMGAGSAPPAAIP